MIIEKLHEDVSEQEFINILQMGDIKMKRLTVGGHSKLDGLELKKTSLPKDILMGPLVRNGQVILPDGDTRLEHGDDIILFGREMDLKITRELLAPEGFFTRIKQSIVKLFSKIKKNKSSPAEE